MQQLHIQLYARPEPGSFTEEESAFQTITLGPDAIRTELRVDARDGRALVEIRLDLDNKPSAFALHELIIVAPDGTELYRWDQDPESLTTMTTMSAARNGDRVVIRSLGDDPFMLLPLARPETEAVILKLSLSELIEGRGDTAALAEAVRSLHSSLRFSIDDLASEQETLQEALLTHQAHARNQATLAEKRLVETLTGARQERVAALGEAREEREITLGAVREEREMTLGAAREERDIALAEVRDDWRSVRRQIADMSDSVARQSGQRADEMSATVRAEFAALAQSVNRLAGAQDAMMHIRRELGVASDSEIIPAVRALKAEAEAARDRLAAHEATRSWGLTAPFRAIGDWFTGPRKP